MIEFHRDIIMMSNRSTCCVPLKRNFQVSVVCVVEETGVNQHLNRHSWVEFRIN